MTGRDPFTGPDGPVRKEMEHSMRFSLPILGLSLALSTLCPAEDGPFRNFDAKVLALSLLSDPSSLDLSYGGIRNHRPWLQSHAALSLLFSRQLGRVFIGGETGSRVLSSARWGPFLGVKGYLGMSAPMEYGAEEDGRDNDDDGLIDESGEENTGKEALFWLAPWAGIDLPVGETLKVSLGAEYRVTNFGRDYDEVFAGLRVQF